METIVIGTKTKVVIPPLDINYEVLVFPLSPSTQIGLVGDSYLEKSQRLEELEKKRELSSDEKDELNSLRRDLSEEMEDISLRKLGYMVQSKDKGDFIATVKELNLASFVVEKLEEALKKSNNLENK